VAPLVVPPAIRRVHRQVGFDLLRVHSLRFIGPGALWARRRWRLDVPVVAHHHHLDPDPLNRVIEKRVVEACDRVIVGSEFARRQLAETLGVRTDHVAVAPYGVDAQFAPRPARPDLLTRYGLGDGPVVLFFGGLKPRKNLPVLLDLWADVVRACPQARLLVAVGLLPRSPSAGRRSGSAIGWAHRLRAGGRRPRTSTSPTSSCSVRAEGASARSGLAMSSGLRWSRRSRLDPGLLVDGRGGFLCDPRARRSSSGAAAAPARRAVARQAGRGNVERVVAGSAGAVRGGAVRITQDAVAAWRARPRSGA
jgi:hypothetical protein